MSHAAKGTVECGCVSDSTVVLSMWGWQGLLYDVVKCATPEQDQKAANEAST